MLNAPRKTKFRKMQKGSIPNKLLSNAENIVYGNYAFKATTFGIISNKQLEAARRVIMKKIKKQGKLWIRVFTHLPKTKKPVEVRMGKGKGSVDSWIVKIKPGTILYEIDGISLKLAQELFNESTQKLPIKLKLVCYS
jgi:large subunit ribosomal protein L16